MGARGKGQLMARIGVYGATGYTGQHVARWLAMRGHRPVLAGRDESRLGLVAGGLQAAADVIAVELDDAVGLRAFAEKCDGIVHCAGPFSRYGVPLVNAAIEAGTPYVDHASQPEFACLVMEGFDERARLAGVAVVPALSFFTALADLITKSFAPIDASLQGVTVAYHVDGWRPTAGTLATGDDLAHQQRIVFYDNEIRTLHPPERRTITRFEFPEPLGRQPVIDGYGGCCGVVTIPRHTATREVRTCASTATFSDAAFSRTGMSSGPSRDAVEPGSDSFMIVVEMQFAKAASRRVWLRGVGDIYDLGALISVLGVERLVADAVTKTGVLGPAEAFGDCGLLEEICSTEYIEGGLQSDELMAWDLPAG